MWPTTTGKAADERENMQNLLGHPIVALFEFGCEYILSTKRAENENSSVHLSGKATSDDSKQLSWSQR
jgi:hypothetical protein